MNFWDLPDDVLNIVFEYSNNYHISYKKFVRKFLFLHYDYNFNYFFRKTNLDFYQYALAGNEKIRIDNKN